MTPTQQINLVGVVEDGGNPRPGVPPNPRQTMRLVAGQDLTVRLTALYRSGGLVNLAASGATTVLSVRKKPGDVIPVINPPRMGTVDPMHNNVCTFQFLHTDFRNPYFCQPGLYTYDIWLTNSGGTRVCLVPLSPLILEPTSTTIPAS